MKECPKCKSCYEDILAECPIDNTELNEGVPGPTILAGKFRVESRLGKGGMGSVYQAMHLGIRRYVALKTLLPQNQSSSGFADRFRREAQVFGRLKHPHVVDVMDFGFAQVGHQQVAYLAMEFLEGLTLKELIRKKGRLSEKETVEIISQVCEAVDAAHKAGVIHRDLKPDNIWLENKQDGSYNVKVLDFGIAKIVDNKDKEESELESNTLAKFFLKPSKFSNKNSEEQTEVTGITFSGDRNTNIGGAETIIIDQGTGNLDLLGTKEFQDSVEELTQTGAMLGTLPYMSPEQCLSRPCSSASDIYSLGIIAYEMLSGQRPFRGKSYEVVIQHVKDSPEPLSKLIPGIAKSTEDAVLKALSKTAEERPSSLTFSKALAANLLEQERKKNNIKKILRIGLAAAVILSITGIITNWGYVSSIFYSASANAGIVKKNSDYKIYSQLKFISLETNKEKIIATTNPIKLENAKVILPTSENNDEELVDSLSQNSENSQNKFLVQVSRDGQFIAYAPKQEKKSKLVVWNLLENKQVWSLALKELPRELKNLEFSQNGENLLFSSVNYVYSQDLKNQKKISTTTLEENTLADFASPTFDKILVASVRQPVSRITLSGEKYSLSETNSILSFWQVGGAKLLDLVHKKGKIESINTVVTTDKTLFLVQWELSEKEPTRQIELWDLSDKSIKQQWMVTGSGGFAIAKDGKKIALKLEPNKITELDITTFQQIKEYALGKQLIKQLAYLDSGDLLAISDNKVENLTQTKTLYSANENTIILTAMEKGIITETIVKEEVQDK